MHAVLHIVRERFLSAHFKARVIYGRFALIASYRAQFIYEKCEAMPSLMRACKIARD